MKSIKDFLKKDQLAKKLGVGCDTIDQWKKEGMPYIKIGKFFFISEQSFIVWFRSHETGGNCQDALQRDFWPPKGEK